VEIRELVQKVKDIANESSRKGLPKTPVYVGLARPWFAEHFGVDLIEYFSDCPALVEKIENKDFHKKDLEFIVTFYNSNCR